MSTNNNFKIENLLHHSSREPKDVKSQITFAQAMADQVGTNLDYLLKVTFADERIFQLREDVGVTKFDALILGKRHHNIRILSLLVDQLSRGGIPVCMALSSDREVSFTQVYKKDNYLIKPTKALLQELFDYLFENPHLLEAPELPKFPDHDSH